MTWRVCFLSGKRNAYSMHFVEYEIRGRSISFFVWGDISATVRSIGLKVSTMVELRPGRVFSQFSGDISRGLQMLCQKGFWWTIFGLSDTDFCHFTVNISKMVSRSVTCQLGLNISSTRAIYKNVSHRAVAPRGVNYKQLYVAFLKQHL